MIFIDGPGWALTNETVVFGRQSPGYIPQKSGGDLLSVRHLTGRKSAEFAEILHCLIRFPEPGYFIQKLLYAIGFRLEFFIIFAAGQKKLDFCQR